MFFHKNTPPIAQTHGANAETRAEQFLQQQGLISKHKNYRCKLGEIDLIMMHSNTLIFIEVRLRRNRQFANAAESVTLSKQRKIIKAAQYYLQQYRLTDSINCRFDVVAFDTTEQPPEWIQDAFSAY